VLWVDISVILTPCFGDIDPPKQVWIVGYGSMTILPFFSQTFTF
jgi:hypothetical protein